MLPSLKMASQLNAPEYFYSMAQMQTNEENFKMYGISLYIHGLRKWVGFYWWGCAVLHPGELLRGHLGIRIHYHQLMNPELSFNGILYFDSSYVTIWVITCLLCSRTLCNSPSIQISQNSPVFFPRPQRKIQRPLNFCYVCIMCKRKGNYSYSVRWFWLPSQTSMLFNDRKFK